MQREEEFIMEAKATLKYARISPRKVKIVLDLIRGKDAGTAMAILKNTNKSASEYLVKLLGSAIANAVNNFEMDETKLYVSECFVCPGPTLKRIMPRAKGSADRILKRTSHVTMTVKERDIERRKQQKGSESKSPRSSRGCDQKLGFEMVRIR